MCWLFGLMQSIVFSFIFLCAPPVFSTNDCDSKVAEPKEFPWKGPGCVIGNVAFGRPTKQSGTFNSNTSSDRAVDGDTDSKGLCSRTSNGRIQFSYWRVDLGSQHVVYNVTLFNSFAGAHRLKDFSIWVTESSLMLFHASNRCNQVKQQVPQGGNLTVSCDNAMVGQYVWVQLLYRHLDAYLTLCEVVVIGYKYSESCQDGKYGPNCDLNCNATCSRCNALTGFCDDGWNIVRMTTLPTTVAPTETAADVTNGTTIDPEILRRRKEQEYWDKVNSTIGITFGVLAFIGLMSALAFVAFYNSKNEKTGGFGERLAEFRRSLRASARRSFNRGRTQLRRSFNRGRNSMRRSFSRAPPRPTNGFTNVAYAADATPYPSSAVAPPHTNGHQVVAKQQNNHVNGVSKVQYGGEQPSAQNIHLVDVAAEQPLSASQLSLNNTGENYISSGGHSPQYRNDQSEKYRDSAPNPARDNVYSNENNGHEYPDTGVEAPRQYLDVATPVGYAPKHPYPDGLELPHNGQIYAREHSPRPVIYSSREDISATADIAITESHKNAGVSGGNNSGSYV